MTTYRKKLIEVALPLDAINAASAREKSIRHSHPSTLHLWWARRPLAAARAVIFAQMVDDPSEYVDVLLSDAKLRRKAESVLRARHKVWEEAVRTSEKAASAGLVVPAPGAEPKLDEIAAEIERERLFAIIRDLVVWENSTNAQVLDRARTEIWQSWRRTCADNADHPQAKELFDRHRLPAFHDPFAGGGALPLEAQRLGLESYASDLNPVAVLINKAMIEVPPKFAGRPPVNPASLTASLLNGAWHHSQGLAADVRHYGRWLRDETERRVGHLYPKVQITHDMASDRPEVKPLIGKDLTVIAWLWARTVPSPDPAMAGVPVPLVASFWLCKKPAKLAWVEPVIDVKARTWRFEVRSGTPKNVSEIDSGTKIGRGTFRCLLSGAPMPPAYLHDQGKKGHIRASLMAVVLAGDRSRIYVTATKAQEDITRLPPPESQPTTSLGTNTRHLTPVAYGYTSHASLFTHRQLVVLDAFTSLVSSARVRVLDDARAAGLEEGVPLEQGGSGAVAYADAVATMLGIAVSRRHDRWTAFSIWHTIGEKLESLIRLSAIPMTWEFAEGNPFSDSTGNFLDGVELTATAIEELGAGTPGISEQRDAREAGPNETPAIVCTDPPYFDNIPYADLSDLFYIWLRQALKPILPSLMSTVLVPKATELVADPDRHGGKEAAERYFFTGMRQALARLRQRSLPGLPLAVFYAFKQSESEDGGTVSTGWESFLSAVVDEGLSIVGTWPVRTEQSGGLRNVGRNSLATSVVLVCRERDPNAPTAGRRELIAAMKAELPVALAHLQRSNIAPVDLAQAAIGPGMAVYTRYSRVVDADGTPISVGDALALINQVLDAVLSEQEGDLDVDSRWALAWFDQYGFADGPYGVAESLSKAKNTSVEGLISSGILSARPGKIRLLTPDELPIDWDPVEDRRTNVWEMLHHVVLVLGREGEQSASQLLARFGARADLVRELAYRLFTACDRKKWTKEAGAYNSLVQSWPELVRLAQTTTTEQGGLFNQE